MTPPRRITIKDVAASLGLDYSSVSYALRGKGTLSEETRRRVADAADRMGYVRNHAASQMRAQRSHTIGLIVPNLVLGYNEFAEHLLSLARQRGYRLSIAISEFDHALEDDAVHTMIAGGVDGVVIRSLYAEWSHIPAGGLLRTLPARGIPVVVHGSALGGSGFSRVVPDAGDSLRRLARHLAEQGFHRPVFLRPTPPSQLRFAATTIEAWRTALATAGVAAELPVVMPDEEHPDDVAPTGAYHRHVGEMLAHAGVDTGRDLLHRVRERHPDADLLVCDTEMTAIGAMIECLRLGIAVPHDLGICANTRNMLVALAPLPLTHIDVHNADLAGAAFTLLMDEIEQGAAASRECAVPRQLVLGASTTRRPASSAGARRTRSQPPPRQHTR